MSSKTSSTRVARCNAATLASGWSKQWQTTHSSCGTLNIWISCDRAAESIRNAQCVGDTSNTKHHRKSRAAKHQPWSLFSEQNKSRTLSISMSKHEQCQKMMKKQWFAICLQRLKPLHPSNSLFLHLLHRRPGQSDRLLSSLSSSNRSLKNPTNWEEPRPSNSVYQSNQVPPRLSGFGPSFLQGEVLSSRTFAHNFSIKKTNVTADPTLHSCSSSRSKHIVPELLSHVV